MMLTRRWQTAAEAILIVVILALSWWWLSAGQARTPLNGDESDTIWNARFFHYLFMEGDIRRPEWGDNYWVHTQPMLSRYIVGASLWLDGQDFQLLPLPYQHNLTLEENRASGRVPDPTLLSLVRAPMVAITTGTMVLLYLLGRILAGPIAGLGASFLALGSPLVPLHLTQALPDAPLMFFVVLALILAALEVNRRPVQPRVTRLLVGVGIALGLGFASKLTAVLSIVAIFVWCAMLWIVARRESSEAQQRLETEARRWILIPFFAYGVFVFTNPHLYSNPPLHTAHMAYSRAGELLDGLLSNAPAAEHNPWMRIVQVFRGSLVEDTALGSVGWPVQGPLALVGLLSLAWQTKTGWQRERMLGANAFVLVTIAVYFIGIGAGLTLTRSRYWVPTLIMGCVLAGIGLSSVIHLLVRGLRRTVHQERAGRLSIGKIPPNFGNG
jgi:hypothetical protein